MTLVRRRDDGDLLAHKSTTSVLLKLVAMVERPEPNASTSFWSLGSRIVRSLFLRGFTLPRGLD